ncbi:MAG: xanthine dehydrogenase family protein subunit M [Spirochaetales bacterium]|nr:xanthine dehydrogenase family protein subunit M [Spirochaetales bacterium]
MYYCIPRTVNEALQTVAEHPAGAFIAGGTDLMILISEGLKKPDGLIDLSRIEDLRAIRKDEKFLILGSAVTMRQLARHEDIPLCLRMGASQVGSPQIRSVATLGGNICNASPCGDTLPGLLVLDAEFLLKSLKEERRVKAKDFFLSPKKTALRTGEILVEVRFPLIKLTGSSGFAKIGQRRGQVISQVNAAVWCTLEKESGVLSDLRIAAGSVAPVPLELTALEEKLLGKVLDDETIEGVRQVAGELIAPITDVRATEEYRRAVMGSLIVDALRSALEASGRWKGGNK